MTTHGACRGKLEKCRKHGIAVIHGKGYSFFVTRIDRGKNRFKGKNRGTMVRGTGTRREEQVRVNGTTSTINLSDARN